MVETGVGLLKPPPPPPSLPSRTVYTDRRSLIWLSHTLQAFAVACMRERHLRLLALLVLASDSAYGKTPNGSGKTCYHLDDCAEVSAEDVPASSGSATPPEARRYTP